MFAQSGNNSASNFLAISEENESDCACADVVEDAKDH